MQNTQIDPHNHEQQLAYELVANTNSSFFLTGRAGTGKTTFLHNVQKLVGKQFITLAPTGVAAILAGGDTIHSFFGLPMEVCTPGTCGKMNEAKILTLLHADTIIIDEVSMVRCDIMDAIDYTMRKALRNNMPFGGKQIIFVGDMFQLPPVVKQGPEKDMLKDLYQTDDFFFYKSDAIKRMRLVKIEFRKVYRQDDEHFLHILENVRLNKVTPENIMHLNDRVHIPTAEDGAVITLASINKTADKINLQRLEEIESEEFVYEGTIDGKFEEKKFPVDMKLRLKVGAQVMFTRNDQQKRWANGTLGKVSKLTKDETNCQLANVFEMATPDAKVLFMIAMLNEMHIGDPGLDLMRKLVEARPKYDLGILALRTLMQCHNLKLDKQSDNNCELVDLFNSDATEEEFLAQLKVCREKAPKAIAYLIRRIKKQEFNEEQPAA